MSRLIAGFLGSLCLTAASAQAATDTYSVSCLAKTEQVAFLNRLATTTHQVVVTPNDVPGAVEAMKISRRAGEVVFLVEPKTAAAAPYPGELGRVCGIIVARARAPLSGHSHDDRDNYIEAIGSELMTPVAISSPRFRRSLNNDSTISIDPAFLRTKLEEFSGARPALIDGKSVAITERSSTAGRRNARTFLKQEYEALGYTVSSQSYSNTGMNLIAERKGKDSTKVLIMSAHLDSVGNAGADDDGSGTISALAVAKALQNTELSINLRILAFDEEEKGLLGSKAYASYLNSRGELKQVVGLYNIEMTAYDKDGDGAFHVIDCNENTSASLSAELEDAIARERLALQKVDACTNRSDHAAFWRYNVPAVVISQNFFGGDSNPCYHKSCDKVATLNFDYMTKLSQAVAASVAATATAKFLD